MLSEGPPRPAVSPRLFAPIDMRVAPLFCLLLLTAACVLASFAFACATPFAAFAVFAGAILPLSAALPVVMAACIVNQAIGFGVLGYPVDPPTISGALPLALRHSLRPQYRRRYRGSCQRSAAQPRLAPRTGCLGLSSGLRHRAARSVDQLSS